MEDKFAKIVTHLQTTGYVFQGSQIYGGLANTWDYGPLGSELKKNLKDIWWQKFVHEQEHNFGIDSAILMNPKVWEATGHVQTFNDPQIDCKYCHSRYRADDLIKNEYKDVNVDEMSIEEMNKFMEEHPVHCPTCGKTNFTSVRNFNLMLKTHLGVTEDSSSLVYLRPETAQGVFVNFKNVQRALRKKLPLGIANVGKSFRNEITPGNFIFRTREFEQMELEFFCTPGEDDYWFGYWKQYMMKFLLNLGFNKENLRYRDHAQVELAFYSKATTDIEYKFPFGWGELWGIANRTDYDLTRHQEYSGESLEYFNQENGKKFIPYCIEPSLGLDRLFLVAVCDAYDEEVLENGDIRKVMHLSPLIAPIKVAVLPLSKQLREDAYEIYLNLVKEFSCLFDETGSIGKRYRRNDEIGTPFCVTYDFDSKDHNTVTVRDRDTMEQELVLINDLKDYLIGKIYKRK